MNYTITKNAEKNGLEIYFESKPSAEVRDALKALHFRWHGVKKCWYGRADEAAVFAALGDPSCAPSVSSAPAVGAVSGSAWPSINTEGLERNTKTCSGAEFAAVIRADLKRRGVTGVTIRAGKATHTDTIRATITMKPEDFRSAEEAAARDGWRSFFRAQNFGVTVGGVYYHSAGHNYIDCGCPYTDDSEESNFPILRGYFFDRIQNFRFNQYHMEPEKNTEITAAALERLTAIVRIINSYNWDNSDSMTDYFDVGFYLDIDIKKPADFRPREFMTDSERVQLAADLAAEEEAERQRFEAYERERKEQEAAARAAAEQEEKDRAEIIADTEAEDLAENEGFYIFGLSGGIGKECSVDELKESIRDTKIDAFISRKVIFRSVAAFEKFSNMLLCDWPFFAGKGGTGTNDNRVNDGNITKLNREQRERVKFYAVDCVAVYLGDALKLVINPEGYQYARYTYLVTEESEVMNAKQSAKFTEEETTAEHEPFYFPELVKAQAEALPLGEVVSIYQPDDWILNITRKDSGILQEVKPGKWAQYDGVYLTIKNGKKEKNIFCAEGKETVIFCGLPLSLPDSVIYSSIRTGTESGVTWKEYRDAHAQIRELIKFYAENGRFPVLDTVQR